MPEIVGNFAKIVDFLLILAYKLHFQVDVSVFTMRPLL